MSLGATPAACTTYLGNNILARSTCDRTVTFDTNQAYRTFPLQATDLDIETMLGQDLNKDRSYSCQFSVHPDATKVNSKVPLSGCCGILAGTPILNSILISAGGAGSVGHLEPYSNPAVPTIRFCGNPVDVP